ncbi:MAG: DUF1864 family protein [Flavobacteriales bacterium]|uniref:PrnB n=2 Tax=Flavobacteriales bacterium TaxID=2021391 RepID=A0AC62AEF3_9FLAO|nr:DUF1864 family protein [Flavobacteriales bacterium]
MISNEISKLDPLNLDAFFNQLPSLNQNLEVSLLIDKLREITKSYLPTTFSINDALAATRDLGMIMSSVRKLGIQPVSAVSDLEVFLETLSEITNMVPRETSYHYGPWNPIGERERRFTHFPDERGLIEGVRIAIPGIELAIREINQLSNLSLNDPAFESLAKSAALHVYQAVDGIGETIKKTDPYVFSHELRPFFDPIRIGGKSYIGAGGGQIPLFVVDVKLWLGNHSPNSEYVSFIKDSVFYLPPELRPICVDSLLEPSVINQKFAEFGSVEITDQVIKGMESLLSVIQVLLKFRKPHFQLAQRTLSKENRGNYTTGSAGYTNSFNHMVLEFTIEVEKQIRAVLAPYRS